MQHFLRTRLIRSWLAEISTPAQPARSGRAAAAALDRAPNAVEA